MARIAGIDLPRNKRGEIGLTYIFGIGRSSSRKILANAGVDMNTKVGEWDDEQLNAIRKLITDEFRVEGELRSEVQLNIKRLMDIGCYRGQRIVRVFPCAVSVPRTIRVPAKAIARPWRTRKRTPSNTQPTQNHSWQNQPKSSKSVWSVWMPPVRCMFTPRLITSLFR